MTLKGLALFALFFALSACVALPAWIARHFGGISLDAILFTMSASLTGVPLGYVFSGLTSLAAMMLVSALGARLALRLQKRHRFAFRLLCLLALAGLAAGVWQVDQRYGLRRFYQSRMSPSTFIEEHYARLSPDDIVFPPRKRNMILLVLESMETTFHDTRLFDPPLLPGLKDLQDRGATFTNCVFTPWTGWTIGSITAFLFGVNLQLPIEYNSYSGENSFENFLPNAFSVLDALDAQGYTIALIKGASGDFSGTNNLLRSHASSPLMYDRDYFDRVGFADPAYRTGWGYRDAFLYERAKEILPDLSRRGAHFFVMMETVDTHAKAAAYGEYAAPYGDERDAFVAADRMACDFLDWLQGQAFYSDTVVVLAGDHPYMANSLGGVELADMAERHIYLTIMNASPSAAASASSVAAAVPGASGRERLFTYFDVAPTLLESLGALLPARMFGLGTSLFAPDKNLLERYGHAYVSQEVDKYSAFFQSFF